MSVHRQFPPKVAKNDKKFSTVILKTSSNEMMLTVWGEAAMWRLPLGVELTLRGDFSKKTYNGAAGINCEKLTQPEGAVPFEETEVQGQVEKPSVRAAIDAGLRAVDYVTRKDKPDLGPAAFAFAAQAFLAGHKLE